MSYAQWNPTTTYVVGNVVDYAGFAYEATAINTDVSPQPTTSIWKLLTPGGSGVSSISAGNSNITIGGTSSNPTISGTLTALTGNVSTANYSFSGNATGNPSFVLGGGQEFKVITTDLTSQILVGSSGVILGTAGTGYTVQAPTVATSASDEQVATTSFVKQAIASSSIVNSITAGTNINLTGTANIPVVNVNTALTGLTANPQAYYGQKCPFQLQYENTTPQALGSVAIAPPSFPSEIAFCINAGVPSSSYYTSFAISPPVASMYCSIQWNGYLYVGGTGAVYKYDSTGATVATFSVSGTAYCIAFNQNTSCLWVGGSFTTVNGNTANNIFQIDSSDNIYTVVDTNTGSEGLNNAVYALYGGSMYNTAGMMVGGQFTNSGSGGFSTPPQNICFYQTSGIASITYDNTFASQITTNDIVFAISTTYSNGSGVYIWVIGGQFTSNTPSSSSYLFIIRQDDGASQPVNPTGGLPTASVLAIKTDPNNLPYVYFGGNFTGLPCDDSGETISNYYAYINTYNSNNTFVVAPIQQSNPVQSFQDYAPATNFGGNNYAYKDGALLNAFPTAVVISSIAYFNSNSIYINSNGGSPYNVIKYQENNNVAFTSTAPMFQQGGNDQYHTCVITDKGNAIYLVANLAVSGWWILGNNGDFS